MTLRQTMKELEKAGTAQNRKVYMRHGVKGEMFGVSYANLRRLARSIRKNQKLASELWATGNHDARVLATMVADPGGIDIETLRNWARDLDNYVLTDALSALASRTPHSMELIEVWTKMKGEWTGQAGWNLVAHFAMNDEIQGDAYFLEKLAVIQGRISKSRNRVRHAMNGSIIAIGMRNEDLEKAAIATAKRIGHVDVDHGHTGCVTPDATDYIEKATARKRPK
jgi:3-methyladenine DNA glycosylase AlkD